jgi:nucleotide-binding universal stress UspA family protein
MLKKIICPVDFSGAATNAIEYSAKLTRLFGASLKLVNVQAVGPVPVSLTVFSGITPGERDRVLLAAERLKETSVEVSKLFGVSCDYEVENKKDSLAETISSNASEHSLIVMGTNGADNLYQSVFGSNTFHVLKKANCPVLIVPENLMFSSYAKVLYVYSTEEKTELQNDFFDLFIKGFEAEISFLEINDRNKTAAEAAGSSNDIPSKKINAEYSAKTINEYIKVNPTDLVVLKSGFKTVNKAVSFHRKLMKDLCETASYAVLVLH